MTTALSSSDPDKFGLLIQCRQKMDQLNTPQLHEYVDSVMHLLSTPLLKTLLFVGLHSMKDQMEYNLLDQIHSVIKEIIETHEKEKKLKNKSKSPPTPTANTLMFIVPKNASFTKTIPFDIISNNICRFLKMSSITRLAQCDRKLAIICHTPSSITNLMHRYDPYQYNPRHSGITIDSVYKNMYTWGSSNLHRFRNVEQLSIPFIIMDHVHIFNSFKKVKHLSFFDPDKDIGNYACDRVALMPLLETISFTFTNVETMFTLLYFLEKYKEDSISTTYFKSIMYQLKGISFIDCRIPSLYGDALDDSEIPLYNNLIYFVLPSQPNHLEVLKFENSMMSKTDSTECEEANDYFENIDSIKSSLSNLKGIVYGERIVDDEENMCFKLIRNILSNLISFKKLESIHTHSLRHDVLSLYLNNNNLNALRNIRELCVSIPMNTALISNLYRMIPKLEKLCLVINITDDDMVHVEEFAKVMASMFRCQTKLEIFQIVAVFDDKECNDPIFCQKKIPILTKVITKMIKTLNDKNYYDSKIRNKQQLVFKFHAKLCHCRSFDLGVSPKCAIGWSSNVMEAMEPFANMVQNMIVNYLVTFPVGKIQFKLSFDVDDHCTIERKLNPYIRGLNRLFRISFGKIGNLKHLYNCENGNPECSDDMDFRQFAVSVTNNNFADESVHHSKKWRTDCRYCCNTPWV